MPNIPKIVRQRLQAQTARPANHPDPDLLTAFAEQSLSERERAPVLEHLSRCGECREILTLALPVSEPVQVVVRTTSASWFSWPAVRWAFASAGLAAIALFGFVQYGHHSQTMRMAKNAPESATIQASKESRESAQNQLQDQTKSKDQDQVQAKQQHLSQSVGAQDSKALLSLPKDQSASDRDKLATASPMLNTQLARNYSAPGNRRTLAHGPRQMNQWQQLSGNVQQGQAPLPAPNAPIPNQQPSAPTPAGRVPSVTEMVEVQTSSPAETKAHALDSVVASNQVSPKPTDFDAEVSRAKSAPPVASATSHLQVQGAAVAALVPTNIPSWTITSGRLQRSFDQGATWQDVNVTGGSDAGASVEISASTVKSTRGSLKKEKQAQSLPLFFRTVTANGPDVWAGGSAAILYHSVDSGSHWSRVVPSSATATLSGDILSLDFPDPQNGRISTSTGEIWMTSDQGQTWQKQ